MPQFLLSFFLVVFAISVSAQKLPESYYRLQAAIDQGFYELALNWADSSIAENPRNPLIWVKRGEAYFRANRYTEAIVNFQMAETFRPGISSYWLARCFAMLGDTTNAFIELERHLSSTPKETEAHILRDTALASLKLTPKWRKLWLNSWYSSHERFLAEIAYHFSCKEWDYALDLLNERMNNRNVRHQLFALRGQAYNNIRSYKAAEADFSQALKRSRRNHQYMAWRAKTLIALNKNNRALGVINQAIDISGGEVSYFLIRAEVFANKQQYGEAIAEIKHYLTFYPNNIDAIGQLAEYSIESGRLIEALFQLGKLIKTNPHEGKYYLLRGKIYMTSSHWAVAEMDFDQAIRLHKNKAEAYLQRGICRYNLGKRYDACDDWQQAIKLGNFEAQELVYRNCRN